MGGRAQLAVMARIAVVIENKGLVERRHGAENYIFDLPMKRRVRREERRSVFDSGNEFRDILLCIVHAKTEAGRGREAECAVERRGTVFARADANSLFAEHLREIVGVEAVEREGKERPSLFDFV